MIVNVSRILGTYQSGQGASFASATGFSGGKTIVIPKKGIL